MTFTRRSSRLAAGLGTAGATVLLLAGPAAADTSQARATAARITVAGSSILDTGQVAASNDGGGETKTGQNSTTLLGSQTLLAAGVLAQDATARDDGTSAACAGAVGSGGIIQVGPADGCTATIGTPNGITLNLNPGLVTLGADAIYAECTASSTAAPTGRATLVDANIFILGQPLPTTLATAPAPNQGLNIPGVATITLNEQTTLADGALRVRALHVVLLPNAVTGQPLTDIVIGEAICGPNAVAPPISIFAGPALPSAVAGAAVVGGVFYMRRRRQPVA